MKKQILTIALGVGALTVSAQNSAVRKAETYVKDKDFAAAKEQIDAAVKHEKTSDKAKTWFIKGQVYGSLADEAGNTDQGDQYLTEAIAAFNKAKELEKENGTYYVFADQSLQNLYTTPFNAGVANFNEQDFESALVNFERAMFVNPADSNAVMNAYVAASQIGNDDKVVEMLYKLTDLTDNPDYYYALISYEMDKNKDYEKTAKVISDAKTKFPDDVTFSKLEVNMYLKQEKNEEAKQALESAIAGDPTNADLVFLKGYLNEQTNNMEEAIAAYEKAQEIDNTHASSAYNLGALYYNMAAETIKEANNLGTSRADEAKRKELMKKAENQFKSAVPHLEHAVKLNPDDTALMDRLMVSYYRVGEKAKGDAMGDKIEELKAQ
jgi:tetratricopeptide (TPR) repeat protein